MATKKTATAEESVAAEIAAETVVSKKENKAAEKFKVAEIMEAHKKFGYAPELIAVALDGCTELTIEEASTKIEAFAKKGVK